MVRCHSPGDISEMNGREIKLDCARCEAFQFQLGVPDNGKSVSLNEVRKRRDGWDNKHYCDRIHLHWLEFITIDIVRISPCAISYVIRYKIDL